MLPFGRIVISVVAITGLLFLLPGAGQATDQSASQPDGGPGLSAHPKKKKKKKEHKVPRPSKKGGTYIAKLLIGTPVRRGPGKGPRVWYASTRTKWSGSGQRLMVLGSARVHGQTWLKVQLPIRPNGASGWIPRDRVQLTHTPRFIVVDTSRRLLRVYSKGHVVLKFKVVVGASSTPTPAGLFALHDRIKQANPNDFVGTWIVTLTAYSNKLKRFDGGPGLVAFHGRAGASLYDPLGSARSHGCVRMNNSRIAYMARAAMGTAVKIQR